MIRYWPIGRGCRPENGAGSPLKTAPAATSLLAQLLVQKKLTLAMLCRNAPDRWSGLPSAFKDDNRL
jgi:hypothetical protein